MISGINSLNLAGIVNLYHWLTPPLCQSYRAVALGILHFVWSLFTMHAHTKNNNYVLYLWCACTVDNSFPELIHSATVIDRGLQCTDMVRHQIAGSFSTNIQVINKSNDNNNWWNLVVQNNVSITAIFETDATAKMICLWRVSRTVYTVVQEFFWRGSISPPSWSSLAAAGGDGYLAHSITVPSCFIGTWTISLANYTGASEGYSLVKC